MLWTELIGLTQHFATASKTGNPPFPICAKLRIHLMPLWVDLCDPAMDEALHARALFHEYTEVYAERNAPA